ncbi:TPM domain-containing protein [Leptospira sp. 96542]|nr:TPM domain-containing protein [Leptospira sp. 96542]
MQKSFFDIFRKTAIVLGLISVCMAIFFLLPFAARDLSAKEIPKLIARVMDEPGLVSKAVSSNWEILMRDHEEKTSDQIVIYIVQSLDGEILEDYSLRLVENWKLGTKKKDNGLLIFFALEERKVRIEVGYGLEEILTDVYCNRIIQRTMVPLFKEGRYEEGLQLALTEILSVLESGKPPKEPNLWEEILNFQGAGEPGSDRIRFIFFGIPFVLMLFLFAFLYSFHQEITGFSMFVFILIFFQWVPTIFYGFWGWALCNFIYIFGVIFIRLTRNKIQILKKISEAVTANVTYTESSGGSASSWNSGGSSSGGGFRGGGGSFGGGGASGSW